MDQKLPAISPMRTTKLPPKDAQALSAAVLALEYPGLAARLGDLLGTPMELILKQLPGKTSVILQQTVEVALRKALDIALCTMKTGQCPASPRGHKLAVAASGAAGGAVGLPGLAVELPLTTTIIFRSIADIARAEGEDLNQAEGCLACLEVFAYGSPGNTADDAAESGYFASRIALARAVSEASKYLMRGVVVRDAPIIARFILAVAARFGIVVSWKAAAQMVPVVGALGGATVNALFMDHFQTVARGHFTIRRLERIYGSKKIRAIYDQELHRLREVRIRPIHLNSAKQTMIVDATAESPNLPQSATRHPYVPEQDHNEASPR